MMTDSDIDTKKLESDANDLNSDINNEMDFDLVKIMQNLNKIRTTLKIVLNTITITVVLGM